MTRFINELGIFGKSFFFKAFYSKKTPCSTSKTQKTIAYSAAYPFRPNKGVPRPGWSHTSESNSQPLAQRVSDYFEKIRPVLSVYSCMNWARNNSSEFTIKETRGNWSKMCPAIVSGIATRWGCAGQLMVLFRPQPPPPPAPSPVPSNSPRSLPFLLVP